MNQINEEEIKFVTKHYKENALDTDKAWKTFAKKTGYKSANRYSRTAVAAAACLVFGVAIGSGIWYANMYSSNDTTTTEASTKPEYRFIKKSGKNIILKYDNESIGNVLKELSSYYGKQITSDDNDRHISGEIEASSMDEIIEILELTLNINIEVK